MNSEQSFVSAPLGRTGITVTRLGLSASYFPGRKAIQHALDQGVNFFFGYGWDLQMVRALRDLPPAKKREIVIATGAYNWIITRSDIRKAVEKRLRQFRTDCIDVFLFLGVMKPAQLTDKVVEDLIRIREEGKVRAIGISTHDRQLAGKLAAGGVMNSLMIRYNAAHRGAEQEIFPHVDDHDPAIIAYTATRWRYLLRRPKGYPNSAPLPTAGQCYRFVLSNPKVVVCLNAPMNIKQLKENLAVLNQGPLTDDETQFMKSFGDIIHRQGNYFMQPRSG